MTAPDRPAPAPAGQPRWVRRSRRALVVAGTLVMGYAVVGALLDPGTRPVAQLSYLIGAQLAHDLVVLPMVIGIGVLVGRYLPVAAQAPVRVAGFITGTLAVVAIPLVLRLGRPAGEPSALPLPYGRNLALVLLVVWAAALTVLLRRRLRCRRVRRRVLNGG